MAQIYCWLHSLNMVTIMSLVLPQNRICKFRLFCTVLQVMTAAIGSIYFSFLALTNRDTHHGDGNILYSFNTLFLDVGFLLVVYRFPGLMLHWLSVFPSFHVIHSAKEKNCIVVMIIIASTIITIIIMITIIYHHPHHYHHYCHQGFQQSSPSLLATYISLHILTTGSILITCWIWNCRSISTWRLTTSLWMATLQTERTVHVILNIY